MIFSKPTPLTDALRHTLAKKALALSPDIGSEEIQKHIPAAIRDRAFFSARTPYLDYLADTQRDIIRAVQPDTIVEPDGSTRPARPGESLSGAEIRSRMKRRLAALSYKAPAEEEGTLTDLSSDRRLNLIINTQLAQARGYGRWRQSQDPAVLDLWPAQELYRAIDKEVPRQWQVRWNEARASLGSQTTASYAETTIGPFVAKKNDPIWPQISAFGNRYAPFDYNSGMRTRDVSRERAEALGVIKKNETVSAVHDPMNKAIELNPRDDTPLDLVESVRSAFADHALVDESGVLHILPDPVATLDELLYRAEQKQQATGAFAFVPDGQRAQLATTLKRPIPAGATQEIASDRITHIFDTHGEGNETRSNQVPIVPADVTALPRLLKDASVRPAPPGKPAGSVELHSGPYRIAARYGAKDKRLLIQTMWRMST